jgi:hypothetical protein
MATKHPEIFAGLMAPFTGHDVKERSGAQGRKLSYVTAATVANRLDSVIGPESWDFELSPWGNDALIGTLIVRLPDGSVVRKSNVGGKAAMQADDDNAKSAASDCFKRCASLLGIGRHLQREGLPDFVEERVGPSPDHRDVEPDPRREINDSFRPSQPAPSRQPADGPSQQYDDRPPTNGRALYAWLKRRDDARPGLNLVKSLNQWAQENELAGKIVDWDDGEIPGAFAAALYYLEQADSAARPG